MSNQKVNQQLKEDAAAACESLDRKFEKELQESPNEDGKLPDDVRKLHNVLREIVKNRNITQRLSSGIWNGEPYIDHSNGIKLFRFDNPARKSLDLLNELRLDIESEGKWNFVRGDDPCGYWKLQEIEQYYFFKNDATEAIALASSIRDALKFVIR